LPDHQANLVDPRLARRFRQAAVARTATEWRSLFQPSGQLLSCRPSGARAFGPILVTYEMCCACGSFASIGSKCFLLSSASRTRNAPIVSHWPGSGCFLVSAPRFPVGIALARPPLSKRVEPRVLNTQQRGARCAHRANHVDSRRVRHWVSIAFAFLRAAGGHL